MLNNYSISCHFWREESCTEKLYRSYLQSTSANFDEQNRTLSAFASYNAGPARISKTRKLAERRELDPDTWFNNVEVVTAEKIGIEYTTYMRNIYKYYAAFKLMLEAKEKQTKAREQLVPGKNP